MKKLIINTDGGARGNPGPAASAFVIKDETGKVILQNQKCLGVATNNEAEYQAVRMAFEGLREELSDYLPAEILVKADSLLVVSQLSGAYKIKNPRLKVFLDDIKNMEAALGEVSYTYIPRQENSEADALVNLALDNQ